MDSSGFFRGMAVGLVVGVVAEMLIPTNRQACVKRQMKRTLHDMEDVMEQTLDNISAAING